MRYMGTADFDALALAVGWAIQTARKKAGLTQEEVAHEADLSLRHYQQIESGRMNATLRTIHDIANALGVDANTLFFTATQGTTARKK